MKHCARANAKRKQDRPQRESSKTIEIIRQVFIARCFFFQMLLHQLMTHKYCYIPTTEGGSLLMTQLYCCLLLIELLVTLVFNCQGRSQHHSPGWARVPLSSFFPQILINFFLFFLKIYLFSSSFWPSGWATRPPGKALATPLSTADGSIGDNCYYLSTADGGISDTNIIAIYNCSTDMADRSIDDSLAGGNKVIFSSGARFQPIDFLNVTDLNRVP